MMVDARGAGAALTRPSPGLLLVHRRYVDNSLEHYAGGLASGALVVSFFNDLATDMCIQTDHDEGLFASYSEITFHAPLLSGDVLEVSAELMRVGRRSRSIRFAARVISRRRADLGVTASVVLRDPILITTAIGTVVVPNAHQHGGATARG